MGPVQNVQPIVSLEYFPPKGISSERALITGAHALRRFNPAYQTITFGAGGSASEGSLEWSTQLQALNDVPTVSHLALCHFDKASLIEFANKLWESGIKRLVVLRGDVAEGQEDGQGDGLAGYSSVADAIAGLKAQHPFDISVAAYPEIHPKANSLNADLDVLLAKQDAGADRAITQYFFNNEDFYRFRDLATAHGFNKPIVPGIIPITNYTKIKAFSEKCAATVPAHFEELFAAAGDDKSRQSDVARMIIEEQVRDLAKHGVDALHIYTLNRIDLTADAIRAFYAEFRSNDVPDFLPALAG
ncbi:MAG: methylenetetrahydrofolate reductase [Rhizobiaceae bacterium]